VVIKPTMSGRWGWWLWAEWTLVSVAGSCVALPCALWLYDAAYRIVAGVPSTTSTFFVVSSLLILCLIAVGIGLGQWAVLREHVSAEGRGRWITGSVVDVAAVLALLLTSEVGVTLGVCLAMGVWAGGVGLIAGRIQRPALSHETWARRWPAAHGAAYAVGWPIGVALGTTVISPLWGWVTGWAAAEIVAGTMFVWLVQREAPRQR